ncbi:uncharacterized protein LOC110440235 [Mizuhopecten yessoensis]|uniref:uncharacterized protein LOC110440235 n=1 Tax=Mizuhopecten yessoensis TaxID=6573 RepID=UPI000B45CB7F|nr:uncharacterized protein LOC110440235 [Mizuhopecten yessoensis]
MASMQLLLLTSLCMTSLLGVVQTVKIQSFNVGLTNFISHYTERLPRVIRALESGDYDVMCLQEVWYGDDVDKIKNKLERDVFTYTPPLNQETTAWGWLNAPPCPSFAALTTAVCIFKHCKTFASDYAALVNCTVECGIMSLSQTCISCLVISGMDNVYRCFNPLTREAMNVPGVMLLSKKKLNSVTFKSVYFEPNVTQIFPRAYIEAEIEDVGTVFCSHSTSNVASEYFEPNLREKYSSFAEQNLADSRQLTEAALLTTKPLIIGDLNTGPGVPAFNVTADFEDSYNHFLSEGFTSPYVTMVGRCTFCIQNPLVSGWEENNVLDHVLVRNHTVLSAKRLYVDNIPGKDVPMSDHYGVEVKIAN